MLRLHTGEVCGDHLGTLHSGCSREGSRGQFAHVCNKHTHTHTRSDQSRRLCVCSVSATVQKAHSARACARRKSVIGLADLSRRRGIL
jgi:hypothetical protein